MIIDYRLDDFDVVISRCYFSTCYNLTIWWDGKIWWDMGDFVYKFIPDGKFNGIRFL